MKLRDFLKVCSEPVVIEKFDECGIGTSYNITGHQELVVNHAVALIQGEEYGLNGFEEIASIWHNDGVLTVTLKDDFGEV